MKQIYVKQNLVKNEGKSFLEVKTSGSAIKLSTIISAHVFTQGKGQTLFSEISLTTWKKKLSIVLFNVP